MPLKNSDIFLEIRESHVKKDSKLVFFVGILDLLVNFILVIKLLH